MFKKIFYKLILLLFIINSFAFANSQKIQFIPDKKVVNKGEKVCFTLINNSSYEIVLPNSAPWIVISRSGKNKGKVVYAPVANLVLQKVPPNSQKKWCWDLKDFEKNYVHSGKYEIRLTYFLNKKENTISTYIEVKAKMVINK